MAWVPCPALSQVVINEIHYAPDIKTEPVEFIELYNPSAVALDLSNWGLTGAVAFTFPAGAHLGSGAYAVVARNPAALKSKFGVSALGPWQGKLAKQGDKITLRDGAGKAINAVDYQLGFPWPTVGDPPGYSIELINPSLDNSLGGNWRASVLGDRSDDSQSLIAPQSVWKFKRGTGEASVPGAAWRQLNFDDSSWETGAAPIGYDPSVPMGTPLNDMRGNYTSVYLRRTFVVADPSEITSLLLEAMYDDGFKLWINGVNVLNRALPSGEVPFDGLALSTREDASWETDVLPSPSGYLKSGTNVIAIQLQNVLLSGSSDCFVDLQLHAETGSATRGPTPGARNSVFADDAPPSIRQVEHKPEQPGSNQTVLVSAKVTDPEAIKTVTLQYQVVDPGGYIDQTDAAYRTNWVEWPMNDAGLSGDERAGDDIYTAEIPAALQVHRRLIRYRIIATDGGGRTVTAPYADDPQPNFAYFVYDGVPAWQGAIQPGSSDARRSAPQTYGTNIMRRFPVYHLLSKKASVEQATWFERYGGDLYKWKGTLVYDGKVYDHIGYRARGGVWRYAMGKNMWKFDFNRGHDFEARDNYGRKYRVGWTKLNLGACIQQGDYGHRGEQGMFESVGFALFNLVGVESPKTHFVQFRVIDQAAESDPSNQYVGDFWGLYLAVEQEDGRFLDEHGLPDGNLYKMEGGTGSLNNQGATAVSDRSDLDQFIGTYTSGTPPSDSWWRTNLDLPRYYSYRAIVEAIHHYDIDEGAGKNYFYYLNPEGQQWSVHSWDLDLTWADTMYGGGNEPFRRRVLASTRPEFKIEYANRIREIRDLLFNSDQAFQLIDEYAAALRDPGGGLSFLDADRAQWDYNPVMANTAITLSSKAGQGRFYQIAPSKDFNGMVGLMKNYVLYRSTNVLDKLDADGEIPAAPTVVFTGPAGFPANHLAFRASTYDGTHPFAFMKWRLAEVAPASAPAFDPAQPRHYEITPDWESGDLTTFSANLQIPGGVAKVGHTYRVRVQVRDATGRASHWSEPVEFVAGAPDSTAALVAGLRISELMYAPAAGSDFEYVELHNVGSSPLDLSGAKFTQGMDFTFPDGSVIAPEAFLLLVSATNTDNYAVFRGHYGLAATVPIVGPFAGKLDNNGETLTLKTADAGAEIISFKYDNGNGWPAIDPSDNLSLHLVSNAVPPAEPVNWIANAPSPGREDVLDSDNDGLPDVWERAHGFDPANLYDAAMDDDADGASNLEEYLSGTDPRAAASRLRIETVRTEPNAVVLSFTAVAGHIYHLESLDAIGGSWQSLEKIDAPAVTGSMSLTNIFSTFSNARFYRIRTP